MEIIFLMVAIMSALLETVHTSSVMIGVIVGAIITKTWLSHKGFQEKARKKGSRWAFWHEPKSYEVEAIVAFMGFIVGAASTAKMMF